MKQFLLNFDSTSLTCDPALFPGKNVPNVAESNRIFPGKGGQDKDFILTYLERWLKFFRTIAYFLDFAHLEEEKCGQSWTKSAKFGFFSFA